MNYSAIDTLYAYEDGDVIIPGMGVSIANGHSLAQFLNPTTGQVSDDSDFTVAANQPTIYPLPYSSKQGAYVIPSTVGQQWYYNNLQVDSAGILDANGAVKSAYQSLFQVTSYVLNGNTYPALKIIGNLCGANDQTNKTLYYVSTYNGMQIVCKIDIPINVSTGTPYNVVISCLNPDGNADTVLDVEGEEYLDLTCQLNTGNTEVAASSYKWQKLVNGVWTNLVTTSGMYTVSSNGKTLRVYRDGVEGREDFRAVCTIGGVDYTATILLSDTRDPFFVDMGRNIPSQYVKRTETVTYTPVVYDRKTQQAQTGWTFAYTFRDDDAVFDTKTGASASITGETIKTHGVVHVGIVASHT